MTPGSLLVRADSGTAIGIGHVMRTLALAQAWQSAGGSVMFLKAPGDPAADDRLRSEGMEVAHVRSTIAGDDDAAETIMHARRRDARWIVVDGYQFPGSFPVQLREAGFRVLHVDDAMLHEEYCADIVLDQNIYASEAMYQRRAPHTQLLLGTSYTMLRREFLESGPPAEREKSGKPHVLVTLGGSDPENITRAVVDALQQIEPECCTATVVVGGANPHLAELDAMVSRSPNIELCANVTDMPELMRKADMAISGGGSTMWELCYMGVPSIAIELAENQRMIVNTLDKRSAALGLRWQDVIEIAPLVSSIDRLLSDAALRQSLRDTAREIIDGKGTTRIIEAMQYYT
jgi:UDP-2,4-diacetamido-2,4,6-trideoxy-beta-L-altropyranose hydrolase